MNRVIRFYRFMQHIAELCLICIVAEQAISLALVPSYTWQSVDSSLIFWLIMFGFFCRSDQVEKQSHSYGRADGYWYSYMSRRRINPTTGLPCNGGIDAGGTPYCGIPRSALDD